MERRWYPLLVPHEDKKQKSLLNNEEFLDGNLIICRQEKYRNYSIFKTYLQFRDFWFRTPDKDKHFYEVILGDKSQKIYFDIDISEDYLSLIEESESLSPDESEEKIVDMIKILRVEIRDSISEIIPISAEKENLPEILIYSSHSPKKENGRRGKMSFHIIINNYCVSSNIQNSIFFEKIKAKVTQKKEYSPLQRFIFSEILDSKIYTSKRQFRILGCSKYSQNRPKIFEEDLSLSSNGDKWKVKYTLRNEIHKITEGLLDSLVTYTKRCNFLPTFEEKKKEIKKKKSSPDGGGDEKEIDINDEVADKVLNLYCERYNLSSPPFSLLSIEQDELQRGILIFKREHPSYCEKCDRVHENENVFFVVWGEEMNVSFDCRRGSERLYLGKLKLEDEVSSLPTEKEILESELLSVESPTRIIKPIKNSPKGRMEMLSSIKKKCDHVQEEKRKISRFFVSP